MLRSSIDPPLIIEEAHFKYLRTQRGRISSLDANRDVWEAAYEQTLIDDFNSLQPFLPKECGSLLDIASGLGGIDILLGRYYPRLTITLMDGAHDGPDVRKHYTTFNDGGVALDFQRKNGTKNVEFLDALTARPTRVFDLVISLQGWCFHFSPETYLDFVTKSLRVSGPGLVIVDVRRQHEDWQGMLADTFELIGVTTQSEKALRCVYRAH